MHHSGDVLAIYSISFHRNSVRIVGTIFGIRFTHLNLKKNLVILGIGGKNGLSFSRKNIDSFSE